MESYMMINRNQLLKISELNLTGKIEQMDEGKLGNFIQLLNSFSDNLPSYDKKIKDALYAKDYDSFTKHLSALRDILAKIYAEEMAQDCTKQIGKLGSEKHEKIEAYMRYFLTNLALLSTDIQKAQKQADAPSEAPPQDAVPEAAEADGDSKKVNIDKLREISELKLDGRIEKMGEDELNNYLQLLNTFTENFPTQEEAINEALKTKDDNAFVKTLSDLRDILEKMHAEEMAQDCAKQISSIGNTSPEKVEAYMRYFLSSLSMLSIDIQMAGQKTAAPAPLPEAAPEDTGRTGIRILAVDDTAFFLTILKKILSDTRYILTCVSSGRDALKYLEKHQPDIFLLDIEMPGMDGYELAARIKESGQKAPIIFLTGNAKKEHLARAVKSGAVDFIIKPINKDVLLTKIHKYLR
jgi:CheY-like chemotaxis protein/HPt (histidine-containing phosphotransfer) domain-containing protein